MNKPEWKEGKEHQKVHLVQNDLHENETKESALEANSETGPACEEEAEVQSQAAYLRQAEASRSITEHAPEKIEGQEETCASQTNCSPVAGNVKGSSPLLLFSVVDIFAIIAAVLLIFWGCCLSDILRSHPMLLLARGLFSTAIAGLYALLHTYWFADVSLRAHSVLGRDDLTYNYEKLALVHPFLLWPILFVSALVVPCGPLSPVIFLTMICLLACATCHWLYLVCRLVSQGIDLERSHSPQLCEKIGISGAFAAVATLCSLPTLAILLFKDSIDLIIPGVAILFTGYFFVGLRNHLIRLGDKTKLGWPGEFYIGDQSHFSDEATIQYNHFVELHKWFRQRAALRSGWKIAIPVLMFAVAAACHLHGVILDALCNGASGGLMAKGALLSQAGLNLDAYAGFNAAANYWLVFWTVAAGFVLGLTGLFTYVRAPKQLCAGKDGLAVRFAGVSGKEELILPWSSIKAIKVERKPGMTSAAGDMLVFERENCRALTLKLAGIPSADSREKLLKAIERYGPEIKREAEIEEILRRPTDHNYTELWLQALAAPPRRERLKPLMEGVQLDESRYHIIGQLGSGGQGFAYLATDTIKDKQVVLKESVLPVYVDINARKQALTSFENEAKLLSRLDHPQVVRLESFFVEDHRAYLVLEHIDGESLRQLVERQGPLPEETIKQLARQMCDILSYLHGLSPPLVHRDFTPDNLILNKDGILKLIDFNVAQQVEYATTGTVVGKQAYLPPEQFRGQAAPASDLYAFGATLYFLAAGKDPTPISVSRPIKDGLPVSSDLDLLISSLTKLDAHARLQTAEAVKQLHANEEEPVIDVQPNPSE